MRIEDIVGDEPTLTIGHQHDPAQFLDHMMTIVAPTTTHQYPCAGNLTQIAQCMTCNYVWQRKNPATHYFAVPNVVSLTLQECVNNMTTFAWDERDCERCGKRTMCHTCESMTCPPVMFLQLLSFEYGTAQKQTEFPKITEQITVHTQQIKEDTPTGLSPLHQQYKLQAIISHCGHTIHSGHFVSYVKRSTSEDKEAWFRFDDTHTSRSSFEQAICPENVGDETPYVFCYVLVHEHAQHSSQPAVCAAASTTSTAASDLNANITQRFIEAVTDEGDVMEYRDMATEWLTQRHFNLEQSVHDWQQMMLRKEDANWVMEQQEFDRWWRDHVDIGSYTQQEEEEMLGDSSSDED